MTASDGMETSNFRYHRRMAWQVLRSRYVAAVADAIDDGVPEADARQVAARAVRNDIFVVAHGGPFEDPESVQRAYDSTDVDGYLGASSIERLPVERALAQTVESFRTLRLTRRPTSQP